MDFTLEDISDDEMARRRAVFEPLVASVRELVDAVIRTEVGDEVIAEAQRTVAGVVDSLRAHQMDGAYGVRYTSRMVGMAWGNAAMGMRNALAPPVYSEREGNAVRAEFTLGAAYEGPPGHVHGGVCALVLDQVLGEAAAADTEASYTGTIEFRYRRPTPLGQLVARAEIVERNGRKKTVRGTLSDADGVTVEAQGLFIVPKSPPAL